MATTSNKQEFPSAAFVNTGSDTIVERYLVNFDSIQTNPYFALKLAQSASPDPVPLLRSPYPGRINLFCSSISPVVTPESRLYYYYDVTYQTPDPNSQTAARQNPDPIERPGEFNIEYLAVEKAVEKARNLTTLPHGDGKGGSRAAGTLGPMVNAAGKQNENVKYRTTYRPVIVFTRNYRTLEEIYDLNTEYGETSNSDTVRSRFGPRTLEYLVTEPLGQRFENNIEHWPGRTRIAIHKTTDFTFDNTGYDYWDAAAGDWKRAKGDDGEDSGDPIFLKLDGDRGGDLTTTIDYRDLEEKAYASLLS